MDKFVDEAKQQLLYEYDRGNDDVVMMLSHGGVNSRVNVEMGRWELAFGGVMNCWKGNWFTNFEGLGAELERLYLALGGYARVQAIEMRGMSAVAEKEVLEKKERGGLLGIFSGK